MPAISVVEAFGPTLQGEGPHAGRACVFLRLGGCNLSCSWCDTPYSWDGRRYDLRQEIQQLTVDQIMDRMPTGNMVIVTGGEPLLQQDNPWWPLLLDRLSDAYPLGLHLETNGTIAPNEASRSLFTHITVSPKLANAGNHRGHQSRAIWDHWKSIPQAIFKIVVENEQDVVDAVDLASYYGMRPRLWVMPQGITAAELDMRWPVIAQAAAERGVNATHRLHVLAWGPERGH